MKASDKNEADKASDNNEVDDGYAASSVAYSDGDDDDLLSTTSVKRVTYTDRDLNIFREECKELINSDSPITKTGLHALFDGNPQLKVLLDKYGFNSLKIKMRTERNKSRP